VIGLRLLFAVISTTLNQQKLKLFPERWLLSEVEVSRRDNFYREKQVQGWSRQKKEALIAGEFNQLHSFARCKNQSHYQNFDSQTHGFDSAQPPDSAQPAKMRPELGQP
jgi:hypothetical protein